MPIFSPSFSEPEPLGMVEELEALLLLHQGNRYELVFPLKMGRDSNWRNAYDSLPPFLLGYRNFCDALNIRPFGLILEAFRQRGQCKMKRLRISLIPSRFRNRKSYFTCMNERVTRGRQATLEPYVQYVH